MKCTQAILLIEREGRGKVPSAEKRRLVKHLRECPECAAYRDCCQVMAETMERLRQPQQQENS